MKLLEKIKMKLEKFKKQQKQTSELDRFLTKVKKDRERIIELANYNPLDEEASKEIEEWFNETQKWFEEHMDDEEEKEVTENVED